MKEPARLSSEQGRLAEALNDLRTQTPGADRLARMAQALAAQGIDVQDVDVLRQPQHMPQPSAPAPSVEGKAGWSVSAKVGLGIGGVVALGLIALLGRGS